MGNILQKRMRVLEETRRLSKKVQLAALKFDEYQKAYDEIKEKKFVSEDEKLEIIKSLRDFYYKMFRETLNDYNENVRKNAHNSETLFCFSKNKSSNGEMQKYYNYLDDTFFNHYASEDSESLLKAIDISDFINYLDEESEASIRELIWSLINYVIITYDPQSFLELHTLIELIIKDAKKENKFDILQEIKDKMVISEKQVQPYI